MTSTDFADGIRKCKDENEVLSITTRNQVQDFYFKCPKPKHDLSQQSMKQKALESNWRSDQIKIFHKTQTIKMNGKSLLKKMKEKHFLSHQCCLDSQHLK
ncbi:CLUMA_CG021598, isoform A [Clunio marinus]|uniref:CLUMA_CG021598, isoform A n=1 Tax=Clunio marinus TaxID=568069 RepID=A0A1J1J848_9DIPT|nr:CLUMA_CG021598, isoform A [Clunio marinus]